MFCTIIKQILVNAFPDAKIKVINCIHNTQHYYIEIIDIIFYKMSLIEQHRMVQKHISHLIMNDQLHAVTIKTLSC